MVNAQARHRKCYWLISSRVANFREIKFGTLRSRCLRRRGGWGMGRGFLPPQPTRGSGVASWAPPAGSFQAYKTPQNACGHRRRPHGARGGTCPLTLTNCWAQGGTVNRRMISDQRLLETSFSFMYIARVLHYNDLMLNFIPSNGIGLSRRWLLNTFAYNYNVTIGLPMIGKSQLKSYHPIISFLSLENVLKSLFSTRSPGEPGGLG